MRFRLQEVLTERGLSQSEFARQSGLSWSTVTRIYNNKTNQVSLATLERLCAALRCEPGELFARGPDAGLTDLSDALRGR